MTAQTSDRSPTETAREAHARSLSRTARDHGLSPQDTARAVRAYARRKASDRMALNGEA